MKQKISRHLRRRALAAAIDYGIFFGAFVLTIRYFGAEDADGEYLVTGIPALILMSIYAAIWFLYFPVVETIFGQTAAKSALRLEVVRIDGKRLQLADAVKRRIVDFMELIPYGIPALIAATQSPYGQRFGDRLAGTAVVADEDVACPECGTINVLSGRQVINRFFQCTGCRKGIDLMPWRERP